MAKKITLYHFTSKYHYDNFIKNEGLTKGDIPISPSQGLNGVWLTTDKTAEKDAHGLSGSTVDKTEVRIKVELDENDKLLYNWPALAQKLKIDRRWYNILNETGGGRAHTWYVYLGPITPDKFKEVLFTKETTKENPVRPSPTDLNIYLNFIYNAVRGGDPNGTTQFLKKNLKTITRIADSLYENIERKTIYRGLILPDPNMTILKPDPRWLYVSFSEDKNAALHFADPSPMTGFGPGIWGNALGEHGYLAQLEPEDNYKILFHWTIFFHDSIMEAFSGVMSEDDFDLIYNQKEVCILQPKKPLALTKVYGK